MITILAGPGEVQKRGELIRIKSRYSPENTATVDLKRASVHELILQLQSQGLFEDDKKLMVIEGAGETLDLLELPEGNTDLVILTGPLKAGSKLLVSGAGKKAAVVRFEAEKELLAFSFIDALLEGKKSAHIELEKLFETYGFMYVLTMVYYGLRRNFLVQRSDFIRQKISKQRSHLGVDGLRKLYQEAIRCEFEIKSGLLDAKLSLFGLVEKFLTIKESQLRT